MSLSLDLILVPQGAEYQAVKRAQLPIPIVAIPRRLDGRRGQPEDLAIATPVSSGQARPRHGPRGESHSPTASRGCGVVRSLSQSPGRVPRGR